MLSMHSSQVTMKASFDHVLISRQGVHCHTVWKCERSFPGMP